MGICVSSQVSRHGGIFLNLPCAAQVIHWNGRLQELWQPARAADVLSHNPCFFLCSSETMNLDSVPRQLSKDEPLQLGQLYFLIPISKIDVPFSLHDLCTLAVKASKALDEYHSDVARVTFETSVILHDESGPVVRFYAAKVRSLLADFPTKLRWSSY